MAQATNVVAVALGAETFGVQRRKAPVLATGKKAIGRRAAAGGKRERFAFAPDVVTVAIYADGKIQIERRAARLGFIAETMHLLLGYPLRVRMIPPRVFVVIA